MKVIVHNSGTMKNNVMGSGYISIKDLLDQNSGMLICRVYLIY